MQPGESARPGTGCGLTSEATTNRTTAAIAVTATATAAIVITPAFTAPPAHAAELTRASPGLRTPVTYQPRHSLVSAAAHAAHVWHLKHVAHLAHLAAERAAARAAAYAGRHRAPERQATATRGISGGTAVTQASTYASPEATAAAMLGAYGWSQGQMGCLTDLWNRESGWNKYAENPGSGAYGIPQALPGSKMASAGADWRTDAATQIRWGLGYIRDSYGSPCSALDHSSRLGWY